MNAYPPILVHSGNDAFHNAVHSKNAYVPIFWHSGKEIVLSAPDPDNKTDKTSEKKSEFFIQYGPDLTVTYTEHEAVYKGYIGFEATKAIIYIKFDEDGTLTKDSFLSLSPDDCDRVFEIKEVISIGILKTVRVISLKPAKDGIFSFGYVAQ